jgi:sugar fermentation stimulation protein A
MRFPSPLIPGMLVRRYKRFLADVMLPDGEMTTAHVANPGAMSGLAAPFSQIWLSKSENALRKLDYTWELVEVDLGAGPELVGVNTQKPNQLIADAIAADEIPELAGYSSVRREVKYGANSRIDFLLEGGMRPSCFVEVKNVHLMRKPGRAEFPDSRTERGAKHLNELAGVTASGDRAVLLFLIQIGSAKSVSVARDIDPDYADAFDKAKARGVEVIARRCRLTPERIEIEGEVPVVA